MSAPFAVRYGHTARLAALALDDAPAAELARAAPEPAEEALEQELGQQEQELEQVEGRPLEDGNPGPRRQDRQEVDGVPRRRAPGPAAAESPPDDWETVEQSARNDE